MKRFHLVTSHMLAACIGLAGCNGGEAKVGGDAGGDAGRDADSDGRVGGGGQAGSGGVRGSGGAGGNVGAGGSNSGTGGAGMGSGGTSGGCQPATCGSHKWPCWRMPNPASSGLPNPASYTDLANGAIRDNVTCLVWEKAPNTTQGTWQANSDRCASLASSNYAGFNDWRLPTRIEMASITDYTRSGYASIFTSPSAYYRTSSDWYETITGQNTSGFAWIYGSNGFTSNAYTKTSNALVRCVRGNGQGEAQDGFAVEPANHYSIASGEVTDNYTGLIWQQTDSATPAGATVIPWADAASYCANLALNGHSWRVPTLGELATLVDEARVAPAINRTAFPNTKYGSRSNNWYWANATYGSSANGWAINYDDGFTGYNAGASGAWNYFTGAWVRCVR